MPDVAAPVLEVRRLRGLLWPGLMTLAMLAVLVGLGTWQVRRLAWKEALLARIAEAEHAPAAPLPPYPAPFEKVRAEGRLRPDLTAWYGAEVRDTPAGPRMGAQLIEPLERANAAPLLVDRGWVPTPGGPSEAGPASDVTIEGYVRPAAQPGWLSAQDDIAARHFYTLDPGAIGAALGIPHVAPFTLVALGPTVPGAYPDPAHDLPRPANNHLSYALTWYGLAVALAAVFLVWSRGELARR